MYWLVMLDNIRGVCIGITVPAVLATLGLLIGNIVAMVLPTYGYCEKERQTNKDFTPVLRKHLRRFTVPVLALLMVGVGGLGFLPGTKQMAAIIIVPKLCRAIESNEGLKEMPNKVVGLANAWIEELKPEKAKEKVSP
jgi:hypothetical protein